MIVDTSVLIDAVTDPGEQGDAARRALGERVPTEPLRAPGHLAVEVLSALRAVSRRPRTHLIPADIPAVLRLAERYGIVLDAVHWDDVHRAHELSAGSLRFEDGLFIAMAERTQTVLLTSDVRMTRSGARVRCTFCTVRPRPL